MKLIRDLVKYLKLPPEMYFARCDYISSVDEIFFRFMYNDAETILRISNAAMTRPFDERVKILQKQIDDV